MVFDFIKVVLLLFFILFFGYVAVRMWTYGYFRSYFDARKKEDEKKDEEKKEV